MHINQREYVLNACVQLDGGAGTYDFATTVKPDFLANLDLNGLYSEILLRCVSKIGTHRLTLASIKLMPEQEKIKITADVLLNNEEHKNVEIENDGKINMVGINRLLKHLELVAKTKRDYKVDSILHVEIIQAENKEVKNAKDGI